MRYSTLFKTVDLVKTIPFPGDPRFDPDMSYYSLEGNKLLQRAHGYGNLNHFSNDTYHFNDKVCHSVQKQVDDATKEEKGSEWHQILARNTQYKAMRLDWKRPEHIN
jgi:hypothetical protein